MHREACLSILLEVHHTISLSAQVACQIDCSATQGLVSEQIALPEQTDARRAANPASMPCREACLSILTAEQSMSSDDAAQFSRLAEQRVFRQGKLTPGGLRNLPQYPAGRRASAS